MSESKAYVKTLPQRGAALARALPGKIAKTPLLLPLLAFFILLLVNLIFIDADVLSINIITNNDGYPSMQGRLVTILNSGSEIAILSIGMTLVTSSSGGQDISVGSAVAIAGSVVLRVLCGNETAVVDMHAPIIVAFLVCVLVSMVFGAFNGILVSVFKIQPMVATLILFTAGRKIAYWIGGGMIRNVDAREFKYFGNNIPGVSIPTPIFITAACIIVIALVLKFTNLGLYTQTVGINLHAARLNGLDPVRIKFITYVIMGVCVAVVGFIGASRTGNINYEKLDLGIEMDVILAVAIGGNALGGGRFNMAGSIISAYTIKFLMDTLYTLGVPSDSLKFWQAVFIIIIVTLTSSSVIKNGVVRTFGAVFSRHKAPRLKEGM
ncbi:MAG: ABC transporter permease [Clostridiales Family XIII bacterium]|jgi:simple sugar transport system permease protein|nr:ABC transporter permease [Clostridiales Family XIII bacterium]